MLRFGRWKLTYRSVQSKSGGKGPLSRAKRLWLAPGAHLSSILEGERSYELERQGTCSLKVGYIVPDGGKLTPHTSR